MRGSDLLLLFLICYDILITVVFLFLMYRMKKSNLDLEKFNEELNFEIAKLRKK